MAKKFPTIMTGVANKPVNIRKTFSFKKLQASIAKTLVDGVNVLARNLNDNMQNHLDLGTDINGKPLEPLRDSTKELRGQKGQGSKPLEITGNMRKTKIIPATTTKPVATIEMVGKNKKGKVYGAYHNQGYNIVKNKFTEAFLPNAIGAKVKKREWFGIPKRFKPGSPDYEKAMFMVRKRIRSGWRK